MNSAAPLKLKAVDAEDVQVISAVLQDAIVPVVDMLWQREERQFIMVTQRLKRPPDPAAKPERVCCAVTLRGVDMVQTQNIDLKDGDRMLDLLALMLEGDALHCVFAGGAAIRVKLVNWTLTAADFGESWPALCEPRHEGTAGG